MEVVSLSCPFSFVEKKEAREHIRKMISCVIGHLLAEYSKLCTAKGRVSDSVEMRVLEQFDFEMLAARRKAIGKKAPHQGGTVLPDGIVWVSNAAIKREKRLSERTYGEAHTCFVRGSLSLLTNLYCSKVYVGLGDSGMAQTVEMALSNQGQKWRKEDADQFSHIAPELKATEPRADQPYTKATDVYALGFVIRHMLSRNPLITKSIGHLQLQALKNSISWSLRKDHVDRFSASKLASYSVVLHPRLKLTLQLVCVDHSKHSFSRIKSDARKSTRSTEGTSLAPKEQSLTSHQTKGSVSLPEGHPDSSESQQLAIECYTSKEPTVMDLPTETTLEQKTPETGSARVDIVYNPPASKKQRALLLDQVL
ncbi:hypothetical protein R1sor_017346 [Riccia sorocarpa]|uniref:Protein kinase domain-containing protein n=1 Tax=Riccia sorocarpa TaxID=122646 RepID=A0ABD3I8D6_9MARC